MSTWLTPAVLHAQILSPKQATYNGTMKPAR